MNSESQPPGKVTGKHFTVGSVATIIVAVLSTPGFVAWLDNGGEKAETSYEVLQAEIDSLKQSETRLYGEIQNLRKSLLLMYVGNQWGGGMGYPMMGGGFGSGSGELMSPEELFGLPAAADGDGDGDADDFYGEGAAEDVSEMLPEPKMPKSVPSPLEQLLAAPEPPPVQQRPLLPDKLDEIMKKK